MTEFIGSKLFDFLFSRFGCGYAQQTVDGCRSHTSGFKKSNHFLSYAYKYSRVDSAYLQLPSSYSESIEDQIRLFAKQAFTAIGAEGYARVDFFVSGEKIYLNEINTSPGMTAKSHFPLLMQHAGYSLEQVVQTLIDHALQRKREENLRSYRPPEV